ncbi:hypothetical protein D6C77_04301 [Aureobasidium pullulans]|uniref:Rhodopsin domain-containing protein n=1 Tax=Aureobasidium pullulans TaxID=5580 RepID=A0A4S9HT67_AURPU|nr:hypothetical protein D6D27_02330 [Aureobasidium pullulans]THW24331.1 hypothetical protein D6D24_00100 [Aureobasidium pullulans]THW47472.1 hypothetical protein D6D21_03419 [Aureobasidium pullulans]THW77559.1 hypothetical protein D6D18_09886 [Aureobasidium pullulans]THX06560.1 hypothetical protein D6D13_06421 [Aureobasidium pullulans]
MSMSSEAIAAKMAASLGVTDMDVAEISRMLELKHTLLPMFQVSVAFLVLAWFAVSLRVYVRASILRSFHWDDWLILLTLCVFTACCACLIAIEDIERSSAASKALTKGFLAQYDLIDKIFGLVMAFMALYIVTTVVLKLALAIFFLRIIPENFSWQRKTIYISTGIYTTYGLIFTFIVIFQCGNPTSFFLQEARKACVSDTILQPLYYTAGGMNALTDWLFSLLPVTVIWSAAIPRSTKISAGCLLGLGSLASIASLIRLAYIPGIEASPTFLEHAVNIASWSIVEPGLGIVAASLATLRPLFRHCFPSKQHTVLPTTHRGKPITYTPGTYVSRMSFEDKINPYGDLQMGSVTTIVGNSKDDGAELQTIDRKAKKTLSSIQEMSVHSRTPSGMSDVCRVDSGTKLERQSSLRSLMRHERYQFPRPPSATKKAYIKNGRVVMSRDIKIEQELSVSHSQPSSPV